MKKNCLLFVMLLLFISQSCDKENDINYTESDPLTITDPDIQIQTPTVNFIAQTPEYEINFNLIHSQAKPITSIKMLASYTDTIRGIYTKPRLIMNFEVTEKDFQRFTSRLTYNDFKNATNKEDFILPENDTDLTMGTYWTLSFIGQSKKGDIEFKDKINVLVKNRFEGKYKVTESYYYRLGVFTTSWNGEIRQIVGENDSTLNYTNFFGPFPYGTRKIVIEYNKNNFQLQNISTPFYGFDLPQTISCKEEPKYFVEFPCNDYSSIIPDTTHGKHQIRMAYGYLTQGSGPRVFYEVLEKVE